MKKGTKPWDKLWFVFFTQAFIAIYVVAGFDTVRYEWSTMPLWLWLPGLAIWLPGNALFTWAMGVNPFFEKTVRIQTERGHHVIDTGPYHFVRHPATWDSLAGACPPPYSWAHGGHCFQRCYPLQPLRFEPCWKTGPCTKNSPGTGTMQAGFATD